MPIQSWEITNPNEDLLLLKTKRPQSWDFANPNEDSTRFRIHQTRHQTLSPPSTRKSSASGLFSKIARMASSECICKRRGQADGLVACCGGRRGDGPWQTRSASSDGPWRRGGAISENRKIPQLQIWPFRGWIEFQLWPHTPNGFDSGARAAETKAEKLQSPYVSMFGLQRWFQKNQSHRQAAPLTANQWKFPPSGSPRCTTSWCMHSIHPSEVAKRESMSWSVWD